LDDLVRRGPNAYRAFLQVLNATGYNFLAEKIVMNEELVRREKTPNISFPVQATNEPSEMYPSGITSGFPISNANNSARNTSTGLGSTSVPQNLGSLGSSSSYQSSNYSTISQSSSEPNSKSGVGGLIVHEMGKCLKMKEGLQHI
jgi:hypothetical protein